MCVKNTGWKTDSTISNQVGQIIRKMAASNPNPKAGLMEKAPKSAHQAGEAGCFGTPAHIFMIFIYYIDTHN